MSILITCLLMLSSLISYNSECTTENISIIGEWDVTKVELVDDNGSFKELMESNGQDYDQFLETIKIFEEVEYPFKTLLISPT